VPLEVRALLDLLPGLGDDLGIAPSRTKNTSAAFVSRQVI
jgi:hypothetical protein